jgi:DUF1680 family protein
MLRLPLFFLFLATFPGNLTLLCAGEVVDSRRSEHAAVVPVRLDEVTWTRGFWADRFVTVCEASIPTMWELMKGTRYKPFYQHFLIASGDVEGEHHGAQWNDGDFYKFLEAVTAAYAVTRDPTFEGILDQSIDAIGRAQRGDGYIHTPVLIRQRNGDSSARPFEDRHDFEMYNMGHLISAACIHHRVTGRDDFLTIAKRTADFLDKSFRNPTPEIARNSVCPSHYMGMVELYRTTRDRRYLKLAEKFLKMRSLVTDGGDDNQDRVPFREQREAVGHAVRANYLYAGAADLYLETGATELRTPLDAIWQNVTQQKMYITGGCGALYDGASPDGSRDQHVISRVHQSYGRNYQLPNATAHNETCAAIGNVLWNWRMFLATGEAPYVDVMELALYNAVLCGISLEGTDYFYVNPLRHVEPLPTPLRWSRRRVPFVNSYCCPPNILRTVAQVNGYAYNTTADAVWINLYGGSVLLTELNGDRLKMTQETRYPWDSHVRITFDECPSKEFVLKMRIPGWAESASIYVNGEHFDVKVVPSSYAGIRRRWVAGDVVRLDLRMPPKLMEAHPLVEEARNHIAIKRGPIVYCLESCDLPDGIRVRDVVVPADLKLVPRYDDQLLSGVTVLEGTILARQTSAWDKELYRSLDAQEERPITVRFIPYYTWANRERSEMSVWLPLK